MEMNSTKGGDVENERKVDAGPRTKGEITNHVVDEFIENTTTHGVPRFLNRDRPTHSRVFWFIVTVGLLGVFLFQGSRLIVNFFQWPSTTKTTLLTKSSLVFPAVTLCNLNMMRRSKLAGTRFAGLAELDNLYSDIGESDNSEWFDYQSVQGTSSTGRRRRRRRRQTKEDPSDYDYFEDDVLYTDWGDDDNDWEAFYNLSKTSDYSDLQNIVKATREELRDYGQEAKDFILQCTYDTDPCSYENFTMIQNIRYGNCFVFNDAFTKAKSVRATSRTGSQYGLHLTLMVEQPEYVGVLTPESGVRVALTAPRVFPFPEDDGITASTGQSTSISLKQKIVTRLGRPYGYCSKKNSSYHYDPTVYDYSRRSCVNLCLQDMLKEKCHCVSDIIVNGSMCSPTDNTQLACQNDIVKMFINNTLQCNDCENPCNETTYDPIISTSLWPTERYEEHLYHRLLDDSPKAAKLLNDTDESRKNLVRVKVYFEQLNFEHVEEIPLTSVEALFGGVGGLLGLYIGMSFVSITEFVIFIIELIRAFCCKTAIQPAGRRH